MKLDLVRRKYLAVFLVAAVLGPIPAPLSDRQSKDVPVGRHRFRFEREHLTIIEPDQQPPILHSGLRQLTPVGGSKLATSCFANKSF